MHNLQSIKKSHRSYEDAIKRFAERGFTNLNLYGSGYSHDIRRDWEGYLKDGNIHEADECRIEISDLFDYGRPRIVGKDSWLYRDSFIKINFASCELFCTYFWDGFKKGIQKDEHTLKIHFQGINIGLGEWNDKKIEELTILAEKCKPAVADKILKCITKANNEVKNWKIALKKSMSGILK